MEKASLTKLERIARNLPTTQLDYGSVTTKNGDVYFAIGRGPGIEFPGISWHGVWGFDYGDAKGIARVGECNGELTLKEAQQQFVDDAAWQLSLFAARGMLDKSYSLENG